VPLVSEPVTLSVPVPPSDPQHKAIPEQFGWGSDADDGGATVAILATPNHPKTSPVSTTNLSRKWCLDMRTIRLSLAQDPGDGAGADVSLASVHVLPPLVLA